MPAPAVETSKLNVYYGDFRALIDVDFAVQPNRITALIGPSGCGKSTLLRTFNRMNDLLPSVRVEGSVRIHGREIYQAQTNLVDLRKRVGLVFQRPNPFPLSVWENMTFAAKVHQTAAGSELEGLVEESLEAVLLWDELKDKLTTNALDLSLEQQQRLCIARLLTVMPEVVLMDEPCSALDPSATMALEALMTELKEQYTILIVTHNMQQAARVSDDCGFMLLGELVEFSATDKLFTAPEREQTRDYLTGRFG